MGRGWIVSSPLFELSKILGCSYGTPLPCERSGRHGNGVPWLQRIYGPASGHGGKCRSPKARLTRRVTGHGHPLKPVQDRRRGAGGRVSSSG